MRRLNVRNGAGENQIGVTLGDIRALANKRRKKHELGLELWGTGNVDAQLLATQILDPRKHSEAEIEAMVELADCVQLAEWISTNLLKPYPMKAALRDRWMTNTNPMTLRAGWRLTASKILLDPTGLNFDGLLDRIEAEVADAQPMVQWTINETLATPSLPSGSTKW